MKLFSKFIVIFSLLPRHGKLKLTKFCFLWASAAFSFALAPISHSELLVEGPPVIVAVEDLLARFAALAACTAALNAVCGRWRHTMLVDHFVTLSFLQ